MAQSKRTPQTSAKKRAPAKKRKASRQLPTVPISRILLYFGLLLFFMVSIGTLFYVIFFQVVVAAELREPEPLPKVVLIIDDMGNNPEIGRALLEMDLNLTFSFLPHSPYCKELELAAAQAGKTVMLHLPLEPRDPGKDAGMGAISVDDSPGRMAALFAEDIEQVPHAVGVNNHMGSKFTEDSGAMAGLAHLLGSRQLFFIDSLTSPDSLAKTVMQSQGVPAASRDIFIDNDRSVQTICLRIEELMELAFRKGAAIGIGHPYPETLEALKRCGADPRSIELVSAGTLAGVP